MPLSAGDTCVVFGGIGRQGNSVAAALVKEFPECFIKLVTRSDPTDERSTKAKEALNSDKVSVVQADANNPDTLGAVLAGATGVFLVTAFWPAEADGGSGATKPLDPAYEKEAALNVVAACKKAGVKHLIYSGLEDTSKVAEFNADKQYKPPSGEADGLVVPHFDAKGQVCAVLNEQTDMLVDIVNIGFYYGNWFGMKPAPNEDGKSYALYLPMGGKKHWMVDVADTGKVVAPLFKRAPVFGASVTPGTQDKSWPISGVIAVGMSGEEIAQCFSEVCLKGAPVTFVDVPVEGFVQAGIAHGMPEMVAKDFGNMFGFFQTDIYCTLREAACKESGDKKLTPFKDWLGYVKTMLYPEVWAA
jgi:nucleoside-diphosphate-sugar epimerase